VKCGVKSGHKQHVYKFCLNYFVLKVTNMTTMQNHDVVSTNFQAVEIQEISNIVTALLFLLVCLCRWKDLKKEVYHM
jgi:hypothetical protein